MTYALHLHWILLPLFTVSNLLLAYLPLAITTKLWIGLFGILLPFGLALRFPVKTTGRPDYESDPFGRMPWSWAAGFLLLAIGFRFFMLDQLYLWPNTDEGMNGILAWDLSRAWRWKFFWTFGELPPLFTWMLALLTRWFGTSLTVIWLLPALISSLTVPLAFLAAKKHGSPSFAVLVSLLVGFSFWPLYMGRFCHQGVMLPAWVFLMLWAMGSLKKGKPGSTGSAVILGVSIGAGSFLFTAWPALAALVLLFVLLANLRRPGGMRYFAWVAASFAVAVSPFLWAAFTEGYGHHIRNVSAFRGYFPLGRQILTDLSYFTALLWGMLVPGHAYGAPWGGLMNPLMGSFLLLGLLEGLRRLDRPPVLFLLTALPASLLPGLLSMNVQMFRVASALPFLLLLAAWGVQSFSLTLKGPGRKRWVVLLLAASFSWDAVLILRPYLVPWTSKGGVFESITPGKSYGMFFAYGTLRDLSAQEGPGLVFPSFTPPYNDATLFVGTYPFNKAFDPSTDPAKARWAAFVVNVHYQPYLQAHYPKGRWFRLEAGAPEEDGGEMLAIIPLSGAARQDALLWLEVHRVFLETDLACHNLPDGGPYRLALPSLEKAIPLVKGDPFLTSLYWEKVEHLRYMDKDFRKDVEALKSALREGLPLAHLYYKLGSIQFRKLEFDEGRANLERALADKGNLTQAAQALKTLDAYERYVRQVGGRNP